MIIPNETNGQTVLILEHTKLTSPLNPEHLMYILQ